MGRRFCLKVTKNNRWPPHDRSIISHDSVVRVIPTGGTGRVTCERRGGDATGDTRFSARCFALRAVQLACDVGRPPSMLIPMN